MASPVFACVTRKVFKYVHFVFILFIFVLVTTWIFTAYMDHNYMLYASNNANYITTNSVHKPSIKEIAKNQEAKYNCLPFDAYAVTLCIHPPTIDVHISRTLSRGIMWEYVLVDHMLYWLKKDPELTLIDLGANIGVYSTTAAAIGTRVLAFEPFPPNIDLLKRSIYLSNVGNRIVLEEKAVSHGYYNMSMKSGKINQAMAQLTSGNCSEDTVWKCTDDISVSTIMLDDLPHLESLHQPITSALLKIDIEGHERETFLASKAFWNEVYVPIIQMEWHWFKQQAHEAQDRLKTEQLIAFFKDKHYRPVGAWFLRELDNISWTEWGNDVYWVKKGYDIK